MIKRLFDIIFSLFGLIILSPLLILISILIFFNSGFKVFYFQNRVGQGGKDFKLFKFRTMHLGADKKGLLTIGGRDPRVTSIGYYLRKYKLDELPQLLNVLIGNMSLVGPRPEMKKYVEMYNLEQQGVLSVKPGITDYASIVFSNENELLSRADDPEFYYIKEIMPQKLRLNLQYIKDQSFFTDVKIIFKTIAKILK
jgi:lipopolysaccharide/colanic/teichoic acid biosynthesis glycosyltransferase